MPALDNVGERESSRLPHVMRALKDDTICAQCAGVVGRNGRSRLDFFAGAFEGIKDLKTIYLCDRLKSYEFCAFKLWLLIWIHIPSVALGNEWEDLCLFSARCDSASHGFDGKLTR